MEKVIAIYKIELSNPIILKRSDHSNLVFEFKLNEFDVRLELDVSRYPAVKHKFDKYYNFPCYDLILKLAKQDSPIPRAVSNNAGIVDCTIPE